MKVVNLLASMYFMIFSVTMRYPC